MADVNHSQRLLVIEELTELCYRAKGSTRTQLKREAKLAGSSKELGEGDEEEDEEEVEVGLSLLCSS